MNTADLMIAMKDHLVVMGVNLIMIVRMIGLIMIEDTKEEDMTVLTRGLMIELMIEKDDLPRLPDMILIHDHVLPINRISFLGLF